MVCNPSMFRFGRKEVNMAGFTVTDGGVKPTQKCWEAIANFSKPVSVTGAMEQQHGHLVGAGPGDNRGGVGQETRDGQVTYLCRTGLEFLLLQQDSVRRPYCGPGHCRLVLAGSRFLKEAETRYWVLAMVFGMEQCKMFLLVCLLPILGDKALDQIKNPRVLSMN